MSETPTFHHLRARLLDLIREDSPRAMGNEVAVSSGRGVRRDLADAITGRASQARIFTADEGLMHADARR
jgi:hypothetical protein